MFNSLRVFSEKPAVNYHLHCGTQQNAVGLIKTKKEKKLSSKYKKISVLSYAYVTNFKSSASVKKRVVI